MHFLPPTANQVQTVELGDKISSLVTEAASAQVLQLWTEPGEEDKLIEVLPCALAELEAAKVSLVEVWCHKEQKFTRLPVRAFKLMT